MPNKLNILVRSLRFFLQLCFAQLLFVAFASAAPHSGDVNGDGNIDNDDLLLLQQFLEGTGTLTSDQKARADVNDTGDATIDDSDYVLLQQIVADGHATHSGLKAAQLGLLINDNDPYSVTIGEYYRVRRGIPTANIVHLSIPVGVISLSRTVFAPLKATVDAALPATVQALAIAWTLPSRIECNSVTSAFARGFISEPCDIGNSFSEPLSPYYSSASTQPFTDFQMRPAMMLAVLWNDDVEVMKADGKALIDRGIASDGSMPSGSAYLMATYDPLRNIRAVNFDPANLGTALGPYVNAQVLHSQGWANPSSWISGKTDALFYFQGLSIVPDIATNTFPPGAVADHLTSYGGMLTDAQDDPWDQMSALQFIQAGATGTFGTVSEPLAITEKFPDPTRMIANYTRGDTLIEAYWKSVALTARGEFVGEPLANPWPRNIRSCAAGLNAVCAEKWSQTISIITAPDSAVQGSTFIVRVHASSGLPVTITSAGGCVGAGLDNVTITMVSGTESCTLNYAQAGNAAYSAAPPLSKIVSFSDLDNDGVPDVFDAFPTNKAASVDADGDGKPDSWNVGCDAACQASSGLVLDIDFDNDGVPNATDNCVYAANTDQLDTDGDGQGDACDLDDDNDGVPDVLDALPTNKAASVDSDHDGKPDVWNPDCDAVCQSSSGLTLDGDNDDDGLTDQEEYILGSDVLNHLDPVRVFMASGSALGTSTVLGMDDPQWQTSQSPDSLFWSSENGGYAGSLFTFGKDVREVIWGDASFCVLMGHAVQCLGSSFGSIANVSALAGHRVSVPLDSDYNCAIASGVVQCWADQDGSTVHAVSAANTALLGAATQLAVGLTTSCAVNGSTAYCWNNADETEAYYTEILAAGLLAPTAIAVGDNHVCAIDNGSVKCWGDAANGKTAPGTITSALHIAAGANHACALTGSYATPSTLAIQCWGDNGVYQTSVPADLQAGGVAVPVDVRASGNETCAVIAGSSHAESAIKCWPIGLNGLNGAATDSDGDGLTDAEEMDGSKGYITNPQLADTDGDDINGNNDGLTDQEESALGSDPLNRFDPVRLFVTSGTAFGTNYVIGMDDPQWQTSESPNSLFWGSENGGYAGSLFTFGKDTREIIVGDASLCVLSGSRAQCYGGIDIANASDLAGHRVSVPLDSDYNCAIASGAVECWTDQDESTVHAVSAANTALLGSATQLAVGLTTSCAVNGSTAYCWNNADETEAYFTEILAADLSAPTAITVGDKHVCAIDNGSVKCWGEAANGKTAPGTITSALHIAAGANHTCALIGSYSTPSTLAIQCWGDNGVYQTAVPAALQAGGAAVPVDVRANGNETCAVVAGSNHAESAIKCWPIGLNGLNDTATDSDGDGLTDAEETDGSRGFITNPQLADTDGDGINDNTDTSPAQAQTITITKKGAVIAMYGSSVEVAANASSGLPVTISGSGGCAGGGTDAATLIMTTGNPSTPCIVSYSQPGNARYAPAPTLSGVTNAIRALNIITITSPAPASAAYGSSFTVAATAKSGLPVVITTTGGCSISGDTVTMTSGSTACVVNYDQAISANYSMGHKSSTTLATP